MTFRIGPGLTAMAAGALLAGCSSGEETQADTPAPAPAPVLTANPVMTQAPDGSALTPGEWVIGEDASGAHARFGQPAGEPVFAMECDAASQRLTLVRAGEAQSGQAGQTFILEAGGLRASVEMAPSNGGPSGGALPMLGAEINRGMPIFQAFAQLGNVITVTAPGPTPGGEVLRMQGAPGIARVIEACSRT